MYVKVLGPVGGKIGTIREVSDEKGSAWVAAGFAVQILPAAKPRVAIEATADSQPAADSAPPPPPLPSRTPASTENDEGSDKDE